METLIQIPNPVQYDTAPSFAKAIGMPNAAFETWQGIADFLGLPTPRPKGSFAAVKQLYADQQEQAQADEGPEAKAQDELPEDCELTPDDLEPTYPEDDTDLMPAHAGLGAPLLDVYDEEYHAEINLPTGEVVCHDSQGIFYRGPVVVWPDGVIQEIRPLDKEGFAPDELEHFLSSDWNILDSRHQDRVDYGTNRVVVVFQRAVIATTEGKAFNRPATYIARELKLLRGNDDRYAVYGPMLICPRRMINK
ncbi:hypothetical protein GCM10023189_43350 [Nibrella saemangeumensis]|uniref:Uncharacterized protein n=1 Tax=Nibrella saemangeumensis TaxID=1084526 RepID=A0ABP8NB92_9BACT